VHEHYLRDLRADGVDGREGAHRLLKDHPHMAAADSLNGGAAGAELDDVGAKAVPRFKQDLAGDDLQICAEQLHQGKGSDALARAAFAHQRQHLAAPDRERRRFGDGHQVAVVVDRDREIAYLEHRGKRRRRHHDLEYGSAASRRPSPTKLKASTATMTKTPGIMSHGA
jgi:hypothetical protein